MIPYEDSPIIINYKGFNLVFPKILIARFHTFNETIQCSLPKWEMRTASFLYFDYINLFKKKYKWLDRSEECKMLLHTKFSRSLFNLKIDGALLFWHAVFLSRIDLQKNTNKFIFCEEISAFAKDYGGLEYREIYELGMIVSQ